MTTSWTSDQIKRFWEQNEADFSGDVLAAEVVRLSRRYMRGHVLDIGAGSGALLDLVPGAMGIDLAPRWHSRIVRGTASALPWPDGVFDCVVATDVLEHLSLHVLQETLHEALRVLRPRGHLVVTTPNRESLHQSVVHCPGCGLSFHRWGHVSTFSMTGLHDLLLSAGFNTVTVRELPLGVMAEHRLVHYLWPLFVRLGFCKRAHLFAEAQR